MTGPSAPTANQIQIHTQDDASHRYRRRHPRHHWGPIIGVILFPIVSLLMCAGTFYLVSQLDSSLTSSRNSAATVQSETLPKSDTGSLRGNLTSTSSPAETSLDPASPTATKRSSKPGPEPIVLLAAGDRSLFDEGSNIQPPVARKPAAVAVKGEPVFELRQREPSASDVKHEAPPSAKVVSASRSKRPQVEDFSHWTAFDARWHAGLYESNLLPRERNSIDRIVFEDLEKHGVQHARLCSDEAFLRRIYLDVLGTLPTAEQAREFINDHSPDKRNDAIKHVMQQPEFADYWAMKWCDLLRVKAEFPINLWPQAAQAYHHWIRTAIDENMPYDRFAYELLTASGSNFRTPQVNFYRALQSKEPAAIAQVVALTFMGERTEYWPPDRVEGMSQFFSRVGYKPTGEWKEEIVYFDRRRNGKVSSEPVKAIYPNGAVVEIPAGDDPRRVLADWLIDKRNKWFARVYANRVWYWLVGRGIVEPVDDVRVDNPPSNPRLLDFLGQELIASGYDVKHLIRVILQSDAYQLSCIPASEDSRAAEHFASYQPRRLDAEVLIDAICQITRTTEVYMSIIPEPFTFLPEGQRAIALPDGSITSSFLETFGRPSRDSGLESERNNRFTAGQALHLLNSNHIRNKIRQGDGIQDLFQRGSNAYEAADMLYLAILSRRATEGELTRGGSLCESKRGAEDLAWALINSDEFLFRH